MINTKQPPTKTTTTPIPETTAYAIPSTVDEHDANLIYDSNEFMSDMVGTWDLVSFHHVAVVGDPPMPWKNGHAIFKIEDDTLVATISTTLILAGTEQIILSTSCSEIENAHDRTTKATNGIGEVFTGKWTTIGPKHHILVEKEINNVFVTTTEIEGNTMTSTVIYPDKPGLGGTAKLLKTTEAEGNKDLPVGTIIEFEGNNRTATKVLKTPDEDTKKVAPGRIISTINHVLDGKPKKKRWWKKGKK